MKEIVKESMPIRIPYRKRLIGVQWDVWGFCNSKKEIIIDCKFEHVKPFSEGLAAVNQNYSWGVIDINGETVLPFNFNFNPDDAINKNVLVFLDGIAIINKNGNFGYIDKNGIEIIPPIYEGAFPFQEGFSLVKRENKWGFINLNNEVEIPFIYDEATSFSEGLAKVKIDNKCGFIDSSGKTVIPFEYKYAEPFSEGLALVKIDSNKESFFIDKFGQRLSNPETFHAQSSFKDGLALKTYYDKKYPMGVPGYINKSGDYTIKLFQVQNGSASPFSDGMALILGPQPNCLAGFIDLTGKFIIPYRYEYRSHSFEHGLALVKSWNSSSNESNSWKSGYIDKEGIEYFED